MVESVKNKHWVEIVLASVLAGSLVLFAVVYVNDPEYVPDPHLSVGGAVVNETSDGVTVRILVVHLWESDNASRYLALDQIVFTLVDGEDDQAPINATLATLVQGVDGVVFTDADDSGTLTVGDTLYLPEELIPDEAYGLVYPLWKPSNRNSIFERVGE
jgi:hypothetical protein